MFQNIYKNKKVLITGHTGFKGSWLSIWLSMLNAKIYGFSLEKPSDLNMFDILNIKNQIEHKDGDIRNLNSLKNYIQKVKPDFIFHLAAQALVSKSYMNPTETISTNVIGTMNLLEVLRKINYSCNCIIITSDKCYDNVEWVWGYKETDTIGGKDIYSGSKGAAELIIKSYYHSFFDNNEGVVNIASARAGNVIGGGDWAQDRIIPDCVRSWSKGKRVNIRSPKSTRPWQHVLEPLSGYLTLGMQLSKNKGLNGESFNFGPNFDQNHSVEEVLKEFSKYWKFPNDNSAYFISNDKKFYESDLLKLNCDKALSKLQWSPTLDYKKTIEITGEWYNCFYNKKGDILKYTINQIRDYQKTAQKKDVLWTR
jgi:CDP-glucose 4,6-dehydratase